MIGKVKITREQAEAISEWFRIAEGDIASLIDKHASLSKWSRAEFKAMNDLSQADMARALLIGYEVEEEYNPGDWVRDSHGYIGKIEKVEGNKLWGYWEDYNFLQYVMKKEVKGKLSPEEIKAEQERRRWAKIGRKPREFRTGDAYMIKDGTTHEIDFPERIKVVKILHEQDKLSGFYPAESFISFGGDPDD